MTKKGRIIADAGLYSSATVLTQLITLAASILSRRFLGPVQMGVWALLQIILNYSTYLTFGAMESVHREIPFHRGKGGEERASEIKDLVFSFSAVTAFILAAAVLVYAVLMRHTMAPEVYYGLLFMPALVILHRLNNLLLSLIRCYKNFSLAARHMVLSSIVNAVLVAFLSARYKMSGFIWAMTLSFVFNITYLFAHHPFSFRWRFDLKKTWPLICYGFPFMILGLVGTLFLTIDKIMIAKMLGFKELGLYSVALLAYSYIGSIPNALGNVMIPNFHEKFGETERAEGLKGYLEKSSHVFSEIMPVLIGLAWALLPYAVATVLPEFIACVRSSKLLILNSFFLALSCPYEFFIIAIRRQLLMLPVLLTTCFLAMVFNYLAIKNGMNIEGVAMATTAVIFIKFSSLYTIACRRIFSTSQALSGYGIILAKFIFMVSLLVLLDRLIPQADVSPVYAGLKCAAVLGVYLLPVLRLNRKMGIGAALARKVS